MSFLDDLRFAFRSLAKARGLSAALIAILGLGIGGATAMFSVVYGVLLKPLPLHKPEQLVMFWGSVMAPPGESDYRKFWSRAPSLEGVAGFGRGGVNLGLESVPLYLPAATVTANFFELLREQPHLGRTFAPEEETPGHNRVVLLSYGLWQEAFGADAGVLGKEIRLSGHQHTIIGVLRPNFTFPDETQMWIPRAVGDRERIMGQLDRSELGDLRGATFGRLREDATFEQARAEVQVLAAEMEQLHRDAGYGVGDIPAHLAPLDWSIVRFHQGPIYVLFAAVGFLLLIACANAANLLLVRSASRQKEIAVRVALGAGRRRILRLLLSEGLLLAAASSALGCLLAIWFVSLIRLLGPADVPRLNEVQVDPAALAFALGMALLTGVFLTLAPAWQASAVRLTTALKEEGFRATGRVGRGIRKTLVVAEVALSVVLMAGAGLMIQTLYRLMTVGPGFDPTSVITAHLWLPAAKYHPPNRKVTSTPSAAKGEGASKESPAGSAPSAAEGERASRESPAGSANQSILLSQANERLLEIIANLPGVISAGAIRNLPLADSSGGYWVHLPGQVREGYIARTSDVSGEYLQTMRIPLLAGRFFDERDYLRPEEPVIISRGLARGLWGEGYPVGAELMISSEKQPRVVVGVVENVALQALNEPEHPGYKAQLYRPQRNLSEFALVVRGRGRAEDLVKAVRTAVASFDKELPVFRVQTMSEVVHKSVGPQRFRSQLFGAFAAGALVLALLGLAAVMAYSVATRTHEMGVRMALGALRGDVLRMVLREGLRLALAGVALGLLGAWWLSRYIASMLYGVTATDPWSYSAAAAVLVAGALLGSLLPALRASRVDPAVALRYE